MAVWIASLADIAIGEYMGMHPVNTACILWIISPENGPPSFNLPPGVNECQNDKALSDLESEGNSVSDAGSYVSSSN